MHLFITLFLFADLLFFLPLLYKTKHGLQINVNRAYATRSPQYILVLYLIYILAFFIDFSSQFNFLEFIFRNNLTLTYNSNAWKSILLIYILSGKDSIYHFKNKKILEFPKKTLV